MPLRPCRFLSLLTLDEGGVHELSPSFDLDGNEVDELLDDESSLPLLFRVDGQEIPSTPELGFE